MNIAEKQLAFLATNGQTTGTLNERWYAFLSGATGLTGRTLNELWYAYLKNLYGYHQSERVTLSELKRRFMVDQGWTVNTPPVSPPVTISNLLPYSNAPGPGAGSWWQVSAGITVTTEPAGVVSGVSAALVQDTDPALLRSFNVIGQPDGAVAADTVLFRFFVKRETPTVFNLWYFDLYRDGPGDTYSDEFMINQATGEMGLNSSALTDGEFYADLRVLNGAEWWEVVVFFPSTTGMNWVEVSNRPAYSGSLGGAGSGSLTGGWILGNMEVYYDTPVAAVRGQPPQINEGAVARVVPSIATGSLTPHHHDHASDTGTLHPVDPTTHHEILEPPQVAPPIATASAPPVANIKPLPYDQWPPPPDRATLDETLRGHEEKFVRIQLRDWIKHHAYPDEALPHLTGDNHGDTLSKMTTEQLVQIMYGEIPAPEISRIPGVIAPPPLAKTREIPPFTTEAATPPDDFSFFAVMDVGELVQWMLDNLWGGDQTVLDAMPIDQPWTAEELMRKLGEHYGWV